MRREAAGRVSAGARLDDIRDYLDRFLRIRQIPDVAGVRNGLQRRNSGRVDAVIASVDACQASIDAAAPCGRVLLFVHHGLMFGGAGHDRGPAQRRTHALTSSDIALYACHIPLDRHPLVGNNHILGAMIGLRAVRPFGRIGRRTIGVAGRLSIRLEDLRSRLDALLGTATYRVGSGGETTKYVAVITGNGTRWIRDAAASGIDTLVTGEAGHHDALEAEEAGVNLLCAGHYATETVGVKAAAAHLGERFSLPWAFFDHPTTL